VELLSRIAARCHDVAERGAVLLREAKQQVAAPADFLEPFRVELDARLVLGNLARERLEIVVRRVVQLLQPSERGIDALDGGEQALDGREPMEGGFVLSLDAIDDAARELAQL